MWKSRSRGISKGGGKGGKQPFHPRSRKAGPRSPLNGRRWERPIAVWSDPWGRQGRVTPLIIENVDLPPSLRI